MKILHTSDWHIGQNFMGKSREEEHFAFFTWLYETIKSNEIDVLIVAGDIFDTGTPPNYALELYYNLLKQLSSISNLYIIITAGNHDSISTLKAPKQLLHALNVHVVTSGDEDENELVPIYKEKELIGIVCAVPFLRDSVVRKSISSQTLSEKELSLNEGIKNHYTSVYDEALKITDKKVPLIATGHLTTVGSRTSESERDIYIGGTIDIGSDFLGKYFDYVALGHLHINQIVGVEHVRYSGSPIALSFSEAKNKKRVNIVTFENDVVKVEELDIPQTRALLVIRGNLESIVKELERIEDKTSWIEIHVNDDNPMYANQSIRELASKLELTLLAVKIDKSEKALYTKKEQILSLDELTPFDVFTKRLELEKLEDKEFEKELNKNFQIVVSEVISK
jgi:DNA repair protein SbcD/Mre11